MYTITVELHGNTVGHANLEHHLTIGRSPDNNLRLEHLGVSRNHAEIRLTDQGVVILDVGSERGTFVVGHKLPANQPYPWLDGQKLQIGNCILTFQPSSNV
jgi:pSer/pThr/pTyr-binding forkhead associated (FHA) protein